MYRHLGLDRVTVPARLTGWRERPTSHSATPSAIGFGSAIGLATVTVAAGAAVLTAAPPTVTIPLAMVLGFGVMVTALLAPVHRRVCN